MHACGCVRMGVGVCACMYGCVYMRVLVWVCLSCVGVCVCVDGFGRACVPCYSLLYHMHDLTLHGACSVSSG